MFKFKDQIANTYMDIFIATQFKSIKISHSFLICAKHVRTAYENANGLITIKLCIFGGNKWIKCVKMYFCMNTETLQINFHKNVLSSNCYKRLH